MRKLAKVRDAEAARANGACALVDVVAHLFDQPGIQLLQEETIAGGDRPDLLLWSDPLVSELGGPVDPGMQILRWRVG